MKGEKGVPGIAGPPVSTDEGWMRLCANQIMITIAYRILEKRLFNKVRVCSSHGHVS